jgi:hypothetical protein
VDSTEHRGRDQDNPAVSVVDRHPISRLALTSEDPVEAGRIAGNRSVAQDQYRKVALWLEFSLGGDGVRTRDSSITRAGWVFHRLRDTNSSGRKWLPHLLRLFHAEQVSGSSTALDPGNIVRFSVWQGTFD